MTTFRLTALSIAFAAASFLASAQTDAEHTQHHPAEPTSKAPKAAPAKSMAKESMTAMDSQMKTMREMHEKMMNAKTPEERNAPMADHMMAMQEGMTVMNDMGAMPGMAGEGKEAMKGTNGSVTMDMASHHQMMEKRMEMMTTMMQMMMDRMPTSSVR